MITNQYLNQGQPILTPPKNVKQIVQDYEDNIILPPSEFRDRPIPTPRTKKPVLEKSVPVPLPRSGYLFKFDDDLFQTENTSLKPFKIIQP